MPQYWDLPHTKEKRDTMISHVEKFAATHNMHQYSAPRENFDYHTAQEETLKLKLNHCIVEDLS